MAIVFSLSSFKFLYLKIGYFNIPFFAPPFDAIMQIEIINWNTENHTQRCNYYRIAIDELPSAAKTFLQKTAVLFHACILLRMNVLIPIIAYRAIFYQ